MQGFQCLTILPGKKMLNDLAAYDVTKKRGDGSVTQDYTCATYNPGNVLKDTLFIFHQKY